MILLLSAMQLAVTSGDSSHCLGAPYLYVSQDGVYQISKYSRDGCLLSDAVLEDNPQPALLRSMLISSYKKVSDALYIADAGKTDLKDSKILVYGACGADGKRQFVTDVVKQNRQSGAAHAYGLTVDSSGDLYASFQKSESVIRFSAGTFEPAPLSEAMQGVSPTPPPGTFFRFDYKRSGQGIRALEFVENNIWIADERTDAVTVVDKDGYRVREIKMRNPIGVYYSKAHNLVFCGSKSSYGVVYAVDPSTYETVHRYHVDGMTHPTGIVAYEDTLFVLLHHTGRLVTFDISSGQFMKTIASGFKENTLEQLVLSNC